MLALAPGLHSPASSRSTPRWGPVLISEGKLNHLKILSDSLNSDVTPPPNSRLWRDVRGENHSLSSEQAKIWGTLAPNCAHENAQSAQCYPSGSDLARR